LLKLPVEFSQSFWQTLQDFELCLLEVEVANLKVASEMITKDKQQSQFSEVNANLDPNNLSNVCKLKEEHIPTSVNYIQIF
jgi:hypothetical protein